MNAASLARSARLRRTLDALDGGGWMTTRDLIRAADICAVNSVVAELRANGCAIETRHDVDDAGRPRWSYRLTSAPDGWRTAA
ncbi:MAG: hypothetical protein ACU0BF_09230 [Paracoccaceae bacterium]